jgi:hypothetical protein
MANVSSDKRIRLSIEKVPFARTSHVFEAIAEMNGSTSYHESSVSEFIDRLRPRVVNCARDMIAPLPEGYQITQYVVLRPEFEARFLAKRDIIERALRTVALHPWDPKFGTRFDVRNYGQGLQETCERQSPLRLTVRKPRRPWRQSVAWGINSRAEDSVKPRHQKSSSIWRCSEFRRRPAMPELCKACRPSSGWTRTTGEILLDVDYETHVIAGIEYVFGPDAMHGLANDSELLREPWARSARR